MTNADKGYNLVKKLDNGKIACYQFEFEGKPIAAYIGVTVASENKIGGGGKVGANPLDPSISAQAMKENKTEYQWEKYTTSAFAATHPEIRSKEVRLELDRKVTQISGVAVMNAPIQELPPNQAIITPSGALLSTSTGTLQANTDFTLDKLKKHFTKY
ncbi:MAG: hypothetical protein HY394_03095 [Candidatus Diapherotrites archaeon]|nr:hypothetical protein [Candidatus Diapherotrites archaeon]